MAPRKPSRGAASTRRNRQKTGKPGKRGGKRRTSWTKGKSGNVNGRPPLPADYKMAIKALEPRALTVLDEVMANPAHPRREQAAEYVLNRAKGTPTQRVEASGPDGGPIPVKTVLTSDEKRARVASLIATARARASGKTGEDDPGGSD